MTVKQYLENKVLSLNKCLFFRIQLNFVAFFVYFLLVFVSWVLLIAIFDKDDPYFPSLVNELSVNHMIQILSTQSVLQFFLQNDPAKILILMGIFLGYCYFFHFLRNSGIRIISRQTYETQKMGIAFLYLMFICLLITILILLGAVFHIFKDLISFSGIELIFLLYLLAIVTLTLISIVGLILTVGKINYFNISKVTNFLRKAKFHQKYDHISYFTFFLSLELIAFGYIFNLNIIVLFCIIVWLLWIVWIYSIFYCFPEHMSCIVLINNSEILNVYVFEEDKQSIRYLSKDEGWVILNKDHVLKIKEHSIEQETSSEVANRVDESQDISPPIFSGESILETYMVIVALMFASSGYMIPKMFGPSNTVLGSAIILVLLCLGFYWIIKKYSNSYWKL